MTLTSRTVLLLLALASAHADESSGAALLRWLKASAGIVCLAFRQSVILHYTWLVYQAPKHHRTFTRHQPCVKCASTNAQTLFAGGRGSGHRARPR